eukprot:UN26399
MVLKDVNAPKRSPSAYILFCQKNRASVADDNPEATMVEMSAILGKMWSETKETDRAPFVNSALKSKAKYTKELEAYKQTNGYVEFQKRKMGHKLIAKYASRIPGAKRKNLYKTFPNDPNKPKKPSSAYFLFSNDNRNEVAGNNPGAGLAVIGKILGNMWKKANATTKAKYERENKRSQETYYTALGKYESTPQCKAYRELREQYDAEKKQMAKKGSRNK